MSWCLNPYRLYRLQQYHMISPINHYNYDRTIVYIKLYIIHIYIYIHMISLYDIHYITGWRVEKWLISTRVNQVICPPVRFSPRCGSRRELEWEENHCWPGRNIGISWDFMGEKGGFQGISDGDFSWEIHGNLIRISWDPPMWFNRIDPLVHFTCLWKVTIFHG